MPKTKFQEVVFTILMVFVMVYAMICYNISLNIGGMTNAVFLMAFHELVIMGPAAFILDFFFFGSLSKKLAFRVVDPRQDRPIFVILAISSITVCLMCPSMSLIATLLFKNAGSQLGGRVAADHRHELPHGLLLADLLRRPSGARRVRPVLPRKGASGAAGRGSLSGGRRRPVSGPFLRPFPHAF